MTLLAGFQALLSRYTGQSDIVVGTPIAGRTRAEIEPLIGFFVNTLVLRTDLSGEPSFLELLRRVRETCLGAYAHQDVPFEKLVEELQPERDLSRSPLFQVTVALQNAPSDALELPGLTLGGFGGEAMTAKFDLGVGFGEESQGGLRCSLVYATDLFDEATVARMSRHLPRVLGALVESAERKVWELPLLTEEEQAQLRSWNDTAVEYPTDACLHELIEQQAERTPGAVAVCLEDARLTYGELNERANQLAHHLRELGAGPEALGRHRDGALA